MIEYYKCICGQVNSDLDLLRTPDGETCKCGKSGDLVRVYKCEHCEDYKEDFLNEFDLCESCADEKDQKSKDIKETEDSLFVSER